MPFGTTTDWRREALPKPEILMYPLDSSVIDSAVLNAVGVSADSTGPYKGRRYLVAGTIISKRDDTQYERYTAAGAVNEVQTITITGTPTGGTFTLTFKGQTTAPIAYNASAATVDTAFELLSTVGAGGVTTGGGAGPATPWTLTFTGALAGANQPLVTANGAALTGGTAPTITVVQTTEGGIAQAVAGILYDTVEFADGTDFSDEPVAFLRRNVSFDKTKIVDYATYTAQLAAALTTCEFI